MNLGSKMKNKRWRNKVSEIKNQRRWRIEPTVETLITFESFLEGGDNWIRIVWKREVFINEEDEQMNIWILVKELFNNLKICLNG